MAQANLVDQFGRPVSTADLQKEMAAPQLAGIRTIWTNSVASGLTPGRLVALLNNSVDGDAQDYLTLAEEIEERNLHYASVLSTRKLAVAGLDVTVEAASDDKGDTELADAVRELSRAPEFGEMVFDLLDALGKGYSAVEINWQTDGPRWIPRYVWRDPRFFVFDRITRAELRLRDEADPAEGLPLPPYKFIVHRPRIKTGIPIRGGLARLGVWAYLFKAFTVKDWMAFVELYGIPMRLGRYGPGATDDDIKKLINAVSNLGSDAAAVVPQSMQIEFENAVQGAGNNQLFERAAEFWDKQVSKAVLGQTATTEGTAGKLGNEDAQENVREDLVKADARQVSNTINRDLVRPFIDLNFGPQEAYPRLLLFVPEPEDIAQLTSSLKELVPLGLKVEQSVVRDKLGLPDPEEGAELLGAPAPAPPERKGQDDAQAANALAGLFRIALNRHGVDEPELDEIEAAELAAWEEQMEPVIGPLRELVESAQSVEELERGLAKALGQMDVSRLTRALATATFKARGLGDASDKS